MGRSKKTRKCPCCSSRDVFLQDSFEDGVDLYVCADCGYEFEASTRGSRRRGDYSDPDECFDREIAEEEWEG